MSELVYCNQSANLKTLEFFPEDRRLVAEFVKSGAYEYDDVPESTWLSLRVETLRLGKMFNAVVVRGQFKYRRLNEYRPADDAIIITPPQNQKLCPQCGSGAVVQGSCSSCGYGTSRGAQMRRRRYPISRGYRANP